MRITTNTTFAESERDERQTHENAILCAQAQTEAAREILEKAIEHGTDSEIWRNALDFAEQNEAEARRDFAKWQQRDRVKAHQTHEFSRLLFKATAQKLEQIETETEQKLSCKIPLPKPRASATQSRC
jgi:Tfp pilus assembly protein PilF